MQRSEELSQEEFDDLLAEEMEISVEELQERSDVDLGDPWEGEIIRNHDEPE